MTEPVFVRRYADLPYNKTEILRYAGASNTDDQTNALLEECLAMARDAVGLSVCFARFSAQIYEENCDFGFASVKSAHLSKNLKGCDQIIAFAATAGVGIYQLQQKYTAVSPSRALMLGAIGNERVETLCDAFCADYAKEVRCEGRAVRPRFSPGFGDLPLSFQRPLFDALRPEKYIGVYLNDHDFMIPPKSVTAIFGIRPITSGEE